MNLLTDTLPMQVEIDGKSYSIRTSYKVSIQFENMMEDVTMSEKEKIFATFQLYYPILPPDHMEAFKKAIWFYYADDVFNNQNMKKSTVNKKLYSFNYDAPYIYAAFLSEHGIDLIKTPGLHWWIFKTLFQSLSGEQLIQKIIAWRGMDLRKFKGEEKKAYQKLQRQVALPVSKKEQDIRDKLAYAALHGGDIAAVLQEIEKEGA